MGWLAVFQEFSVDYSVCGNFARILARFAGPIDERYKLTVERPPVIPAKAQLGWSSGGDPVQLGRMFRCIIVGGGTEEAPRYRHSVVPLC